MLNLINVECEFLMILRVGDQNTLLCVLPLMLPDIDSVDQERLPIYARCGESPVCVDALHFFAERLAHPRRGWKPEFKLDAYRRWMERLVRFGFVLGYP